jgi:hypothetical protein
MIPSATSSTFVPKQLAVVRIRRTPSSTTNWWCFSCAALSCAESFSVCDSTGVNAVTYRVLVHNLEPNDALDMVVGMANVCDARDLPGRRPQESPRAACRPSQTSSARTRARARGSTHQPCPARARTSVSTRRPRLVRNEPRAQRALRAHRTPRLAPC